MAESFIEAHGMRAKEALEQNVDEEKKEEERKGAEPAAHIKERDVPGLAELGPLADQDLSDQKSAQDKKQLHAIKAAVTENTEGLSEMRVEDNESMRANHHHDGRGPKQIEAENAAA